MAIIVAVVSNKGGVGKTTTTFNLGIGVAMIGYKVLLVDADPRSDLTVSFQLGRRSDDNLGNFLIGAKKWNEIVYKKELPNGRSVDIAQGSTTMANLEPHLLSQPSRERILKRALEKAKVRDQYDFIFIDCHNDTSTLTQNVLCAADEFLAIYQPQFYSANGLPDLFEYIQDIVDLELNPSLQLTGVLINQFNENMKAAEPKVIVNELRSSPVGEKVYKTYIRQNDKLQKCVQYGQSIFEFDEACNGSVDYKNLVDEFLSHHHALITNS